MTLGFFPSHWNHFCPLKVNSFFPEKILGLVYVVPCNSNKTLAKVSESISPTLYHLYKSLRD